MGRRDVRHDLMERLLCDTVWGNNTRTNPKNQIKPGDNGTQGRSQRARHPRASFLSLSDRLRIEFKCEGTKQEGGTTSERARGDGSGYDLIAVLARSTSRTAERVSSVFGVEGGVITSGYTTSDTVPSVSTLRQAKRGFVTDRALQRDEKLIVRFEFEIPCRSVARSARNSKFDRTVASNGSRSEVSPAMLPRLRQDHAYE